MLSCCISYYLALHARCCVSTLKSFINIDQFPERPRIYVDKSNFKPCIELGGLKNCVAVPLDLNIIHVI